MAPLLTKEGLGEVEAYVLTPLFAPLARGDAKYVRRLPMTRLFRQEDTSVGFHVSITNARDQRFCRRKSNSTTSATAPEPPARRVT